MNVKQASNRNRLSKLFGLSLATALLAYAYPGVSQEGTMTPPEATEAPATVDTPTDVTAPGPEATETPDTVEVPAQDATGTEAPTTAATPGTLTQVVAESESFGTLETALKAAGLDGALSQAGPFTIFAPTDEAFAELPAETLEALLQPQNQALLQQVLAYHVVSGNVTSDTIQPGEVATVQGNSVAIAQEGETVTVSGARVVEADINASNGVIHAIDKVLLPPGLNLQ